MTPTRLARSLGLFALLALHACSPAQRRAEPASEARLPSYTDLARAHNQRVEGLDMVWARSTIVIDSTNEDGSPRRDQGEGHLQIIRPDRVALSVGKLGETGFYLGSNPDGYWWFDLSGSEPIAWVGTHAGARTASARRTGAPVHPLDLVEVIGVLPLPEQPPPTGPVQRVYRTDDGLAQIVLPARSGYRLLSFEPASALLRRVELYNTRGELLLMADLQRYGQVRLVEGGGNWPSMPDRIRLESPGEGVGVTLSLYGLENRGSRQSDAPFDLPRLLRAYRIGQVNDIDDPEALP